jgi:hypothetical protein
VRTVAPLVAAAALALCGCGYKPVRYGGGLGDVRSVAVQTLRNDSYEPGAEFVVSEALRREFLRRGAVALSEDPAAADVVLSGRVERVAIAGRAFSSVLLVLEFQLTVYLEIHATRRDGSEIPLDANALRESERFLASADLEAQRKNRDEAMRRVASVLAGRVHDGLFEALVP